MFYRFVTCLLLLHGIATFAQTAAPSSVSQPVPALPKEPAEIFAEASKLYDFASPALKPWHMRVNYEIYDEQGKSSGQGTYEYWWTSPDTYRSTWLRPGMVHTDWHVGGKHYSYGSGESLAYFERKIQSDLLTPLPDTSDLDSPTAKLLRRDQKFGGIKLPCVMIAHKMSSGPAEAMPFGLFPTYCFNPDQTILRAYYAFGSTQVIYNKVVRLQGMMLLPREFAIFDGTRKVLSASVDVINGLAPNAKELTPDANATTEGTPQRVEVKGEIFKGTLLTEVRPHYPPIAMQNHEQGKVVLRALIGTDGHVHDLSVQEGPNPSLVQAAMWAVSQWVYQPYLLNGQPVEVDTTINVVFQLGGK